MQTRHSPLASTKFTAHQENALQLLRDLAADIEKLQEQFDDNGRTNWGYVEELGHLRNLLREAHNFLNNEE